MILPVMKPYTIRWPLKSGFYSISDVQNPRQSVYSLLIYHNFFNIDNNVHMNYSICPFLEKQMWW